MRSRWGAKIFQFWPKLVFSGLCTFWFLRFSAKLQRGPTLGPNFDPQGLPMLHLGDFVSRPSLCTDQGTTLIAPFPVMSVVLGARVHPQGLPMLTLVHVGIGLLLGTGPGTAPSCTPKVLKMYSNLFSPVFIMALPWVQVNTPRDCPNCRNGCIFVLGFCTSTGTPTFAPNCDCFLVLTKHTPLGTALGTSLIGLRYFFCCPQAVYRARYCPHCTHIFFFGPLTYDNCRYSPICSKMFNFNLFFLFFV